LPQVKICVIQSFFRLLFAGLKIPVSSVQFTPCPFSISLLMRQTDTLRKPHCA
jgi:hypothetical protein